MTFTPRKILLSVSALAIILVLLFLYFSYRWLTQEINIPQDERIITIEKGSSLYSLANKLHQQQLLQWPTLWVRYAQFSELAEIKAGEFLLPESLSPRDLLILLNKGEVIQYQTTLVEGLSFKEILKHLHQDSRIESTLKGLTAEEIIQALQIDVEHLEGWFFPDTYNWTAGDSDKSILLQAHKKMRKVLQEEWENRAEDLPYNNLYEALIMASIVERETGAAFEREHIAGVFIRRLQMGMRLQTDPTVIYGMGDTYTGNITRKDLKTATPYNTYVIKGLPPTPIAMPGREAIHASLHPAPGTALYFVARGDGTHEFSATVEEHNKAVRKYQLKRKSDYRSRPLQKNEQEQNEQGQNEQKRNEQDKLVPINSIKEKANEG